MTITLCSLAPELDLDESAKRHAWAALPLHVRIGLIAAAGGGAEKFTLRALCAVLAQTSGQLEEMRRDARNVN
jgi:hypothetical protein